MVLTCTERHFLTGRNFLDSGNKNVWNHPYMSLSLSVATHDVGGKKGNKNEYPLESRCRYLITVLVFYTIYALIGRCGLVGSTITLLKTSKIIMTYLYI